MVSEPPAAERPTPPRVLVVAPHGSYRTAPFIDAARRLGAQVLIASEGRHSVVSAYAEGLHIRFDDPQGSLATVLAEAEQAPFAGVIGTDDASTEFAARVAGRLGLAHNEPSAVRVARRKDLARARLAEAGVRVPDHRRVSLSAAASPAAQVAGLGYPVVVKPLALSASRGVIRADGPDQLERACQRVRRLLGAEQGLEAEAREHVLVERFVPGEEVALEGMLRGGELQVLAVFDKPDPLEGPYFEETYYVTPSRLAPGRQAQLADTVAAACRAYGLSEGPVHAECRINEAGVWVLEVAARTIGGLCSRLLRVGTGYGLEELVLAHAMGGRLEAEPEEGGAGVLMIPITQGGVLKRVEGLLEARRVPFVEDIQIQIREGNEVVPLPEGASYLGFIFARAPTPAEAEQALRRAHACLNVVVAPLWRIQVA